MRKWEGNVASNADVAELNRAVSHAAQHDSGAAELHGGGGIAEQRAGKYLAFRLGKEDFAIQVLKVREIVGIQDITSVPQMPAYVKGVINLRGKVIPVVDLRLKFGLQEREYTQRTCIIVVQVQSGSQAIQSGVIVDEVSEVLNLTPGEIEDTPDFGEDVGTPYLLGMAKAKDSVKMLLDIDQVLANSETMSLAGLTN